MTTPDPLAPGDGTPFRGFPAGARAVPLPAALFTTLLPAMDDPAELLVTLYAASAVQRQRRFPRVVAVGALRAERALVEVLSRMLPQEDVDVSFARGLDAAVARGTLLALRGQRDDGETEDLITMNSAPDRRAVERAQHGRLAAGPALRLEPAAPRAAATVYALYESTVGPLTPQIAEELAEAEGLYSPEWIRDAFREAAELNKRSWRYIRRILERWQAEGRDDAAFGGHSGWRSDSRYEHLIRH